MDLSDLPTVMQKISDCWNALGRYERDLKASIDGVIGTSQRQCLVAKRSLSEGDEINLETTRFAFPCIGIPVEYWDMVESWKITTKIPEGDPIRWEHVRS